ncbi:unnamed protein product [Caenorhabditis angaria]|uniref:Secreted protein n=1 Tax=Caenorhabditis angaria TaxID=860376 RepID=A0A9P1IBZ7_9PELO|nr:unnamed protein product [Caenorhabditis angaria]
MMKQIVVLIFIVFISMIDSVTIGKRIQIPDKDQSLRNLVYKVGLPKANAQIHDSVLWVPGTTQFSAQRITVIQQNKPYSTWHFDMLLEKSNCAVKTTPLTDLPGCKAVDTSVKVLCIADVSLFDGDYSSAESEVRCSRQ